MEKFIRLAPKVDMWLGYVLLAFALYQLVMGNYVSAGIGVVSAFISFASAKVVPSKWLMTRMLGFQLKQKKG